MTHDRVTLGFYIGCFELLVAGLWWSYRHPRDFVGLIRWSVFAKLIGAVIIGILATIGLTLGIEFLLATLGSLFRF